MMHSHSKGGNPLRRSEAFCTFYLGELSRRPTDLITIVCLFTRRTRVVPGDSSAERLYQTRLPFALWFLHFKQMFTFYGLDMLVGFFPLPSFLPSVCLSLCLSQFLSFLFFLSSFLSIFLMPCGFLRFCTSCLGVICSLKKTPPNNNRTSSVCMWVFFCSVFFFVLYFVSLRTVPCQVLLLLFEKRLCHQ